MAASWSSDHLPTAPMPPGDGIVTFAERIQERVTQLSIEKQCLRDAGDQIKQLEEQEIAESNKRRQIRSGFLQSQVHQQSMERECCQIEDRIAKRRANTKKLKLEETDLLEKIGKERHEWETTIEKRLVQHQVRQEIYQKYLEGAINDRQRDLNRRKYRQEKASQLIEQSKRALDEKLLQQQQIQADMMQATELEDDLNKKAEELATQVRNAVTKVRDDGTAGGVFALLNMLLYIFSQRADLRDSLRETQQAYQNAHDEADKLANEYRRARI